MLLSIMKQKDTILMFSNETVKKIRMSFYLGTDKASNMSFLIQFKFQMF